MHEISCSWIRLHSDTSVFVTLLFGGSYCNRFELFQELGLTREQLFDILDLLHVF